LLQSQFAYCRNRFAEKAMRHFVPHGAFFTPARRLLSACLKKAKAALLDENQHLNQCRPSGRPLRENPHLSRPGRTAARMKMLIWWKTPGPTFAALGWDEGGAFQLAR
jgi:hypothetical protein